MAEREEGFIPALHGLRGIAAISVVTAHIWTNAGLPGDTTPFLGVALFFLLSGFLMGHLYIQRPFTGTGGFRFAIARFARIYPLFAVVVIVSAILETSFGRSPFGFDLAGLPAHLLLAGSGRTVWTISSECQFYLAFVFIWLGYAALPGARDRVLVIAALVAVAAILALPEFDSRIALPRYLHLFLLGLVASVAYRHFAADSRPARVAIWLVPVFAFFYLVLFALPRLAEGYHSTVSVLILSGLLFSVVLARRGWVVAFLGSRPLTFLGEISFGIYLLQRFVEVPLRGLATQGVPGPAILAMELGGTIAAATVAHWIIERPARRAVRGFGEWAIGRARGGSAPLPAGEADARRL